MTPRVKRYYLLYFPCTVVFCPMPFCDALKIIFVLHLPLSCQTCGSVLTLVDVRKTVSTQAAADGEEWERGYKLKRSRSSEEQQALKPITRCAKKKERKITVDLTHEEQLLFYAQIKKKKRWGPKFHGGVVKLFCFAEHCYHGLFF